MESRRENRYRPSALCRWWLCRGNRRTGLYRRTSLAGTTQGKKHPDHSAHQQGRYTEEHRIPCHPDKGDFGSQPIPVSAKEKTGVELIRQAILEKLPEDFDQQSITGSLKRKGDLVLLVMPQDIQAPKGRLILPQVQTQGIARQEMSDHACTTDKQETLQVSPALLN